MRLHLKLFLSYLVVVAVGLLALVLSTAYVAPQNFSQEMRHSMMAMDSMMNMGQMRGGQRGDVMRQLSNDELEADFRQAINQALFTAAVVAIITAAILSWITSRRIVRPIHAMLRASQHIAEGNYNQRLPVQTADELGDLSASFNRMATALAETEQTRRQLIADVSHELKTPLASINGFMEGLQDGVIPATPETFQLVHEEVDRLQRLVQDLQELSRAEAAALQMNICACNPVSLINGVVEKMRPQFNESNITLVTDLLPTLPNILADADRTSQVLTNLLGNALQYTPAGGSVTIRAQPNGTHIEFSVQDTGLGLKAEDLQRVFQRFYRVDKSRARASGGSGIGLTIAYHLVETQGGHIWATSPGLNQGSTFHFTLPRA